MTFLCRGTSDCIIDQLVQLAADITICWRNLLCLNIFCVYILELDDGAYNPLWTMRGFTQTFHFWKETRRAQSVPLNAFLTYITLPWWSIAKGIVLCCKVFPKLEPAFIGNESVIKTFCAHRTKRTKAQSSHCFKVEMFIHVNLIYPITCASHTLLNVQGSSSQPFMFVTLK
jgi:hypothetical protein